jgi:hypothetical protein
VITIKPHLARALLVGLVAAPSAAGARPASRGFHAEAGLGAVAMLGDGQHAAAPGPVVTLRLGYDLTSWAALSLAAGASSHEATVPPPPEGEWFQLYQGRAELRLSARAGAVGFFAEGGAGAAYISSNLLAKVGILDPGERVSLAISAGGGLEYQLQNRHYAFGLGGAYWLAPGFSSLQGVEVRLFLRYTYGGSH